MTAAKTQVAPNATLKAYQNKITAQLQEAKATLELVEAKAKAKSAQAEIAAINGLKTAKQNIDRKLQDLKATHDTYVSGAKAGIDADVATFKASINELAGRLKSQPAKK